LFTVRRSVARDADEDRVKAFSLPDQLYAVETALLIGFE
jgi:hypothetical protein